jgi:hypothetical protein
VPENTRGNGCWETLPGFPHDSGICPPALAWGAGRPPGRAASRRSSRGRPVSLPLRWPAGGASPPCGRHEAEERHGHRGESYQPLPSREWLRFRFRDREGCQVGQQCIPSGESQGARCCRRQGSSSCTRRKPGSPGFRNGNGGHGRRPRVHLDVRQIRRRALGRWKGPGMKSIHTVRDSGSPAGPGSSPVAPSRWQCTTVLSRHPRFLSPQPHRGQGVQARPERRDGFTGGQTPAGAWWPFGGAESPSMKLDSFTTSSMNHEP